MRRGFSLIEVLVLLGILSVVGLGAATMISQLSTEQMIIGQKYEMLDLKQTMLNALSNPATCVCMLNPTNNATNSTSLTFDSTAPNPPAIMLDHFYAACDGNNHPTSAIVSAGQALPGSVTGLKVASITLRGISSIGAPGAHTFQAEFDVQFDPHSMLLARQPIMVSQIFSTDPASPANAQTIISCQPSGASSLGSITCVSRQSITSTKIDCGFTSESDCNAGETAYSGGMWGAGNTELQDSEPVLNNLGHPVGWVITAFDTSGAGTCTGNNFTPTGSVVTGTANPAKAPCFPLAGNSKMCGAAVTTCCK